MQLLQDIFIIENLQVLSEGKNTDTLKLRGVFGRCNEKNNNGRIYPTAVLEGQLQKIQPLIDERRLCGELDHPQNDTVKLSNASHLITKLELKGDELIGEAELLKTPAGLTAKALVEGGVKIGISSRGMGTLSEDAQGNKIVNEDFRLVTFDLVADPSTRGAYPALSESTESRFVKDSTTKLQKESNFLTLLESKLKEAYTPFIEESRKKKRKKLTKKQRKLDMNKNNRLDSEDFSMLRAKVRESVYNYMSGLEEENYGQAGVSPSERSVSDADKETSSAMARERAAKAEVKAQKQARKTLQMGREARGEGIRGSIKKAVGKRIGLAAKEREIPIRKRIGVGRAKAAGEISRERAFQRAETKREKQRQSFETRRNAQLNQSTSYAQFGVILAEAFGLIEDEN